ncbi:hypothetical protein Z517_07323 [Fonsecaea pedrosoi CBS 271.37]|uniref:Major facilitator superfamily (MFS) profile domain-containing protein n=1 Tax=Fonsecaea pedrosoi CBS 271.37 TaxID=1442368 RepID=A0A0D2F231_9EURO|nr:uncharacterized protein Z517_07323 [Fonsecaea pedrosoi CBS 271.37]KIW80707.1 hypothetical protein Z517_07323 [Fonsecaea pedrosoi CBS 271.37]
MDDTTPAQQNDKNNALTTTATTGPSTKQEQFDLLEQDPPPNEAEERRLRNKIDRVILPLMALVFFSQYVDKQSLSYAAVFGLVTDLDLHGRQYSWLSSIFYLGQLLSEFPFIYLMSRLPLARFVGVTVIIWGIICMCLAACNSFSSMMGVRFILGFAEGAVQPAFVTLTSIWYKKREHPMRIGIWISCNGLAQVLGALMMYGIGKNPTAIAAWRIMFLVCGAITIFAGILFTLAMPSGPESAWFLTPAERIAAKKRLQLESEGGDRTNFAPGQLKEALLQVRTWLNLGFGILITLPAPVLVFASLIINSLGYDKYETMLYTSPSGAVQIFFIWVGIALCFIWPNRRCCIIVGLVMIPLTGIILLFTLPLTAGWGMIVASWLASVISNIFSLVLSLSASNVRGNTKKAVVNALFFIGYAAGAVIGPLLWDSNYAPRYQQGLILALVSWIVFVLAVIGYWYSCYWDNRKKANLGGVSVVYTDGREVTDKGDPTFRYTY